MLNKPSNGSTTLTDTQTMRCQITFKVAAPALPVRPTKLLSPMTPGSAPGLRKSYAPVSTGAAEGRGSGNRLLSAGRAPIS